MQLVEQHSIGKRDPRFQSIDAMAFAAKNLWNLANYAVRQSFIFEHSYLNNTAVYHLVKSSEAYQAMPRKVSSQVLIQLDQAWRAFFEAMQAYREHPEQFTGRPKLPKYKHKTQGRKHNQEFVHIPHARFIELLCYKAELVGIRVLLTEESYTNRASLVAGMAVGTASKGVLPFTAMSTAVITSAEKYSRQPSTAEG